MELYPISETAAVGLGSALLGAATVLVSVWIQNKHQLRVEKTRLRLDAMTQLYSQLDSLALRIASFSGMVTASYAGTPFSEEESKRRLQGLGDTGDIGGYHFLSEVYVPSASPSLAKLRTLVTKMFDEFVIPNNPEDNALRADLHNRLYKQAQSQLKKAQDLIVAESKTLLRKRHT